VELSLRPSYSNDRCASAPLGQPSLLLSSTPLSYNNDDDSMSPPSATRTLTMMPDCCSSITVAATKKVVTPGRVGDGLAVEIRLEQRGRNFRGYHEGRVIGDTQDNLVVSYRSDAAATAALMSSSSVGSGASPPPSSFQLLSHVPPHGSATSGSTVPNQEGRFLVAELLRESGHPFHTHLIVSDASRNAIFVIMKRNFHKQLVVHQIVGDAKVHTDKSFKYTVLGEKVKMARCGPRDESTGATATAGLPATDWVMWGKVRVGTKEVRKYLAERSGSTVLFYDVLAALPIHDLFALSAGLIELWDS